MTPLAEPDCDPLDEADLYASASIGQLRYGATTVTLCGGYRLDPGRAHPLLDHLPDVIHLPAHAGHHSDLQAAVDLLGSELADPRLGVDTIVPALLDMLLLYILRVWFEEQPAREPATGWAAALADPAISAALDGIHRAPEQPWSVETLGRRAGLSRAAFSRRFSALVGQPPATYLTWWRLTSAARSLCESDASLAEVARRVGYTSEYAFANAFKRQFGTAPGRYRRQGGTALRTGNPGAASREGSAAGAG